MLIRHLATLALAVSTAAAQVRPGIEVLVTDSIHLIRGKRVGLITNHSGRTRDGRSSIDLLYKTPGVRLTALFGPEHGLRGIAQAGDKVANAVDSATGVPVYSLYGQTLVPRAEDLKDVDVLVYDIQDVGARVYTFEWTMALSAAATKLPFIVCDRPDPIRADRVEGNILESPYKTFVGQFEVALRYGLTPAELLRFLAGEKMIAANFRVVPMQGYTRAMWYDETTLPWINPSPNIKSLDGALLYPGTVFFEGTNLSEGRGTDAPFQLVGAPWLDDIRDIVSDLNAAGLAGVRFEATERVIEAGQKLAGPRPVPMIFVKVTDRNAVKPVAVGLKMLRAIYTRHSDQFKWIPAHADRLAGTAAMREAVQAGTVDDLIARWDADAKKFTELTRKYWLYPPSGPGAGPRTVRDSVVAPGVRWRRIADPKGPWSINIVRVDLRGNRYEVRAVRAHDSLATREKVTDMVARQPEGAARVIAAINGDFFNLRSGENENGQVIAGEWWKGLRGSDSPYDAFAAVRTHFVVAANGKPLMDRFVLDGAAIHQKGTIPVLAVNFLPRSGPETVALFTARMGAVPADTNRRLADAPLRAAGRRGDTLVYVVAQPVANRPGRVIPPGGAALVGYGPRATTVATYAVGDTVRVLLRAAGRRGDGAPVAPAVLIGGWPRILAGGVNVAARSAWDEGTLSTNADGQHPRSAVGFNRDSSALFLATVDGRQESSSGMTLVELASLLKAEGVWDALNFDGGGSTALVLKGRLANVPSDSTGERPVGNALLVVSRMP